jgi:carbamoyl-phosphate synthase/aspartate carbamoyltransferase/dihydroorotase
MHAERQSVAVGIGLAAAYERPVHFCHISRREEIELIADAKMGGLPVTCEVTPHHLFLSAADAERLGPLGDMRPVLGTPDDVVALWEHLGDTVDCIATDHAPHTLEEKRAAQPPPGVPGLETSLPLMASAVVAGKLTLPRLVALMSENPRRIYDLPEQADTEVEIDLEDDYIIDNRLVHSKCGWTPFAGTRVRARVQRVTLHGQVVYEGGAVLAPPGSGRVFP